MWWLICDCGCPLVYMWPTLSHISAISHSHLSSGISQTHADTSQVTFNPRISWILATSQPYLIHISTASQPHLYSALTTFWPYLSHIPWWLDKFILVRAECMHCPWLPIKKKLRGPPLLPALWLIWAVRGIFWKVVLGFRNFGYDVWEVGGDV